MAFLTLFWVNFWRQIRNSILSFVKNPLYTASSYTKMSLKTSQAVKNSEIVNALLVTYLKPNWFTRGHFCVFMILLALLIKD